MKKTAEPRPATIIADAAAHASLGAFVMARRQKYWRWFARFSVSAVITGGVLVLVTWLSVVTGYHEMARLAIPLFTIMLSFGLSALLSLLLAIFASDHAYLYESGLVFQRRRNVEAVRWSEVDAITVVWRDGKPREYAVRKSDGRTKSAEVLSDEPDPLGERLKAIAQQHGIRYDDRNPATKITKESVNDLLEDFGFGKSATDEGTRSTDRGGQPT